MSADKYVDTDAGAFQLGPDPETLALAMLDVAERAGSDDEAANAIRRIAAAGGGGAPFRGAERPRPAPRPAPRPNPYA
jgi:hypothetical protein